MDIDLSLARALARALDPPRLTADLPDIAGTLRARPEDFEVVELPLHAPDGTPDRHVMLTMRKRDLGTEQALQRIADAIGLPRAELGVAGLKDKVAVTEQFMTAPARVADALRSFRDPQITLGEPLPHGHKLRRGQLLGNRFSIVVRGVDPPPQEACALARQTLDALRTRGGLVNAYGPQRFDHRSSIEAGLDALRRGRVSAKARFAVSVAQSALFNVVLALRHEAGWLSQVRPGDVMIKTDTGGRFVTRDPEADMVAVTQGTLSISGPMFGSRMLGPPPQTDPGQLERRVLAVFGLDDLALGALGSRVAGSRRALQVPVGDPTCELAPAAPPGLQPGLRVRFDLPPGAYATTVFRELLGT